MSGFQLKSIFTCRPFFLLLNAPFRLMFLFMQRLLSPKVPHIQVPIPNSPSSTLYPFHQSFHPSIQILLFAQSVPPHPHYNQYRPRNTHLDFQVLQVSLQWHYTLQYSKVPIIETQHPKQLDPELYTKPVRLEQNRTTLPPLLFQPSIPSTFATITNSFHPFIIQYPNPNPEFPSHSPKNPTPCDLTISITLPHKPPPSS